MLKIAYFIKTCLFFKNFVDILFFRVPHDTENFIVLKERFAFGVGATACQNNLCLGILAFHRSDIVSH